MELVKMKSAGVGSAPNPIWLVSFIKKENLDTDMHTETMSGESECRDWGDTSTSQRMPEI